MAGILVRMSDELHAEIIAHVAKKEIGAAAWCRLVLQEAVKMERARDTKLAPKLTKAEREALRQAEEQKQIAEIMKDWNKPKEAI